MSSACALGAMDNPPAEKWTSSRRSVNGYSGQTPVREARFEKENEMRNVHWQTCIVLAVGWLAVFRSAPTEARTADKLHKIVIVFTDDK